MFLGCAYLCACVHWCVCVCVVTCFTAWQYKGAPVPRLCPFILVSVRMCPLVRVTELLVLLSVYVLQYLYALGSMCHAWTVSLCFSVYLPDCLWSMCALLPVRWCFRVLGVCLPRDFIPVFWCTYEPMCLSGCVSWCLWAWVSPCMSAWVVCLGVRVPDSPSVCALMCLGVHLCLGARFPYCLVALLPGLLGIFSVWIPGCLSACSPGCLSAWVRGCF